MDSKALYAGTFDPITTGHIDIICRASKVVQTVVVGVALDGQKKTKFTFDERVNLVKKSVENIRCANNVEVVGFEGLLVAFAKSQKISTLVRGLRAVSDFEFEFQMAAMNRKIAPDMETIFLMASDNQQFISSKFIKEIHRLGGNVENFVSKEVLEALTNKKDN